MKPIRELMMQIESITADGGEWCTVEKALTLASMIVAMRARLVVEIGVWRGGSFLPMALAMDAVANGAPGHKIIGIDPWQQEASVAGQTDENEKWWGSVDHDAAFEFTLSRLAAHKLPTRVFTSGPIVVCNELVEIWRMTSTGAPLHALAPSGAGSTRIDLLHVDGNHADAALADVQKFAPHVRTGGFVVLDDIGWSGGHVEAAGEWLTGSWTRRFIARYDLAPGRVYQRIL